MGLIVRKQIVRYIIRLTQSEAATVQPYMKITGKKKLVIRTGTPDGSTFSAPVAKS